MSEYEGMSPPARNLLRGKPFILSMGPQRAGTTWLDRYFRYRGDVCMPAEVKEVFFFDRHYDRGIDFYLSHFDPKPQHKYMMEISTTSFDHPDAPEHVYESFGNDLILLCPLRHPIIRSYSLYHHYKRYGITTGSLQEACEEVPQILFSSHYAQHLENWSRCYGIEKIHIIFQEDLEENQEQFVQHLCDILELNYIAPEGEVAVKTNVTTATNHPRLASKAQIAANWLRERKLYAPINVAKMLGFKRLIFGKENPETLRGDIPQDDYEWLRERLFEETDKLESLLGYKLDIWRKALP